MSGRSRAFILASLFILVLLTVSVHSDPRSEPSWPQKVFVEMVATFQNWLTTAANGVEDLWMGYFYLVGLAKENQDLHRTVDLYKTQVNALREKGLANQRLTRLLKFATERDLPMIGARVVGWGPGPWFRTVTVDRGLVDGLAIGMPVVNDQGVVGRVVEATPRFAKVLLLTDYSSSVDAVVQRSRARGVMAGRSEASCSLKYVRTNENVVRGDVVITSGMGGPLPRGLLLGTVSRVKKVGHDMFQEIDVMPMVDFDRLEEVLIVMTSEPPL